MRHQVSGYLVGRDNRTGVEYLAPPRRGRDLHRRDLRRRRVATSAAAAPRPPLRRRRDHRRRRAATSSAPAARPPPPRRRRRDRRGVAASSRPRAQPAPPRRRRDQTTLSARRRLQVHKAERVDAVERRGRRGRGRPQVSDVPRALRQLSAAALTGGGTRERAALKIPGAKAVENPAATEPARAFQVEKMIKPALEVGGDATAARKVGRVLRRLPAPVVEATFEVLAKDVRAGRAQQDHVAARRVVDVGEARPMSRLRFGSSRVVSGG